MRDSAGPHRHLLRRFSGPLLAAVTLVVTTLTLEVVCRLIGLDFEFKEQAFRSVPIFVRQPTVPIGQGLFRRPGPDVWRGNAIDAWYRSQGGTDDLYRAAPWVVIRYDAEGFRNPPDLRDWEVVVAGDSFTELGFLPDEDLFTAHLSRLLGVRVKNLGVSHTGTFTQTAYLRHYGGAPSARDAVVVFFEGNDFVDLPAEHERMEAFARSPSNPDDSARTRLQALPRQTSLLHAIWSLLHGSLQKPRSRSRRLSANADFMSDTKRIPVSIEGILPPDAAAVDATLRMVFDQAIGGWADTARTLGLRAWLAYMPCKRRVLDGHLEWHGMGRLPPLPKGFAELIAEIAAQHRVRFINLTPALRRETALGHLTYNAVADTHLNALGSATVGRELARVLASAGRDQSSW